ncbi:hypothetical protein N9W17_05715 [Jannaschia sp.]|nr:hypothetical protein [Jannaschia sp.]
MYDQDSLFTLTPLEIAGVLAISLAMWLACAWLVRRGRSRAVRLALAVGAFAGFAWLSPQVYYLYYMIVFEGLPWQIVLDEPPSPLRLLRLLSFTAEATLSRHGQGVLGWSLLAVAFVSRSRGVRP